MRSYRKHEITILEATNGGWYRSEKITTITPGEPDHVTELPDSRHNTFKAAQENR